MTFLPKLKTLRPEMGGANNDPNLFGLADCHFWGGIGWTAILCEIDPAIQALEGRLIR